MNGTTPPANKQKLLDEFNAVVADTEKLLNTMANESGEKAAALRATIEQNLTAARERLAKLEETVLQKTKEVAQTADAYVHEHPWRAVGIAAGVGAGIGVLLGLLMNRR